MDFSISSLAAGFLYGVTGLYQFRSGKKNQKFTDMFIGLTLMIYPYFISNSILLWGLGAGLIIVGQWVKK